MSLTTNSSITSPVSGNRSRRVRNLRDSTGAEYQRLEKKAADEKAARESLAGLDLPAIRREAKRAGWQEGYDAGTDAGQEICARVLMGLLTEEGIGSVEALLREWIAADADQGEAE